MKFKSFVSVIELLKRQEEKERILYEQGLDIINFNDDMQKVITILIGSIYGDDGLDTFQWWCYDKEWGTKDLEMRDHNGNLLCQTMEELYEYLEENKSE